MTTFLYKNWDRFCSNLADKNCIRADEITEKNTISNWICVKHDVETNVAKALKIAQIENKYNIRATYYVQSYLLDDNLSTLRKIADLGHEVTYHYDVLDSNNGDIDKAIDEFTSTIHRFNDNGFEVNTVCPHGNPVMQRSGWSSNKDFFRNSNVVQKFPNIFDIVVHSDSLINNGFKYISDAGYEWKWIGSIGNNDIKKINDSLIFDLESEVLKVHSTNNIIISSHPHRWSDSQYIALFNLAFFKGLRYLAKFFIRVDFLKRIMSKFYHLAKKI